MKKIIHLSDLHIGYGDLAERFEHIVSQIIARCDAAERVEPSNGVRLHSQERVLQVRGAMRR